LRWQRGPDQFAKIAPSSAAPVLNLPATQPIQAPTAAERVLAAELQARGDAHDALSLMVSSVVHMVQAGKSRESRWQDR
jgi:hypothetical protein